MATAIKLSDNNIMQILKNSFVNKAACMFLDLERNAINTIEDDAFQPLNKLIELRLSFNPLLYILDVPCSLGLLP